MIDLNGATDGTTNFVRTYAAGQRHLLTAPATQRVGTLSYGFTNWAWRSSPTGGTVEQALGQRDFEASVGTTSDTAIARYLAFAGLNVRSTNPTAGVNIVVSPADYFGAATGATPFIRQ